LFGGGIAMRQQNDFITARDNFFLERGWCLKQCPKCSGFYFTKKDLANCGAYTCVGDNYTFLDIPAPKDFIELDLCQSHFLDYFNGHGYQKVSPLNVTRENERTLFASAAGQVFDCLVYEKKQQVDFHEVCVIQPVIRLQGIDLVGETEGFSTSFLNAGIDQWGATIDQHFIALDRLLDFFSLQDFYVGNLCMKYSYGENDWSNKNVFADMLRINYGGLEIGIANYFSEIPQNNSLPVSMSDISIGLERFLWARNKTASYFDAIGPLTYAMRGDTILMDTLRTLTLMAGSGVMPGHQNHGYKLRLIANRISNPLQKIPFSELIEFYYKQWSSVISLPIPMASVNNIIEREIDRNAILALNERLGVDESIRQTQEEFLHSLLKKKIFSLAQLRCLLGEKI